MSSYLDHPGEGYARPFILPRGSSNPKVYVVAEAGGREEAEQELTLVGVSGKLFDRAIVVSSCTKDDFRMWNVVPYRPIDEYERNRTPSDEDILKYSELIKIDIRKKKPKTILLTGKSAMTAFGINMSVGEARTRIFNFEEIPIYVTYHPSYVARNGGENSQSFGVLVSDIKRAYVGQVLQHEINNYKIVDVQEFDYVIEIFKSDEEVILDYEASGLNTYHYDYFIGGMALKGRTSKKCVYVNFYDFWLTPEERVFPEELRERIGKWLLSKHLVVFNLQYECSASLTFFKVYLRNVTDVLMMNRTLGYSGTLKEIATRRLGVNTWNSDVDEYNNHIIELIKRLKPSRKNPRKEWLFIKNGDGVKNIPVPSTIDEVIYWLKLAGSKKELIAEFEAFDKLIKKYINGDRYLKFCMRLFKLLTKRAEIKDLELRFTDIPIEIIAPYAIADADFTDKLKDNLWKEIESLKIERAAEIYNCQAKLGFEMESAGIAWDDELAAVLDKQYDKTAITCLRNLLMVPKFQKILPSPTLSTEEKNVPVAESSQDILKIQTETNVLNLMEFFNPRSTHVTTRERFNNLIVTPRLKFCMLLYEVFKEYQNSKEEAFHNYPVLGSILESIITLTNTDDRVASIDVLVMGSQKLGKTIQNHPENHPDLWRDDKGQKIHPPEIKAFIDFSNWKLSGMNAFVIEDLYNAWWHIAGIDVDNKDTWTDEFKWIYWFRLFKKVMKSHSTYVWGSVGRGTIALIDKKDVHKLHTVRYPGWKEKKSDDQIWIKETNFGVCTASTKRYQSGDHTVPWESELINLRISRFPDGVRVHYDYSQNEVRVLAKISNCKQLLERFEQGIDIHGSIAADVWQKPQKEISKAERRYSKMSTFAIVYGDTYQGFAVKFLSGNLNLAKYIFDNFYGSYPEIRTYIEDQHRFALQHGYVKTFFGDPLRDLGIPREALELSDWQKEEIIKNIYTRKVIFDRDRERDRMIRSLTGKALRNSQNWPIQSTSSTLAGLGAYYINEFIKDNNMTSRVDCFTHDSDDIDAQIADVPKILSVLPRYAVSELVKEFDLPIKTDFEIGVSGDESVELKHSKVDGPLIEAEFHDSKKTALESLEKRLTKYGVKCEISVEEETPNLRSMSELFVSRRAFALAMGEKRLLVSGHMKLDFSDVRRES
jgi:uracil-DNA glycosylase family 4